METSEIQNIPSDDRAVKTQRRYRVSVILIYSLTSQRTSDVLVRPSGLYNCEMPTVIRDRSFSFKN